MRRVVHLIGHGEPSQSGFYASLCGCWWGSQYEFASMTLELPGTGCGGKRRMCKSCSMLATATTPVAVDRDVCRVCGRTPIEIMCYRHTGICSGLCESAEKKAEMQKAEGKKA